MKDTSKQRGLEGGIATGGIFAIITGLIKLIQYFFPSLPWAEIMPLVGAVLAYFAGGKVSQLVHKYRVAQNVGD